MKTLDDYKTARIVFAGSYAPVGFLIVAGRLDCRIDDERIPAGLEPLTRLIQSDWDYPGVASALGFVPCECGATDGTIDCPHKTAAEMIGAAYDYLEERQERGYPQLLEYLA